jgi:hypothetical protein
MKHALVATLMLLGAGCRSKSPVVPQTVKPGEYLGTIAVTFNAGSGSAFIALVEVSAM